MHKTENLQVLYEDNHLIAVVKPAGLLVQSDHSGDFCLLETVRQYLREQYLKPGDAFVGLLHRLDRPVSGVILFAKTSKGASRISDQIRKRTITKTYHALVEGMPEPREATLVHHLGEPAAPGAPVEIQDTAYGELKRGELAYRVLEVGPAHSLVEIDLRTGRKHQIRAQMARIGHPLAGDQRYGATLPFSAGIGLMAYRLEFTHPIRQDERVVVELPKAPREAWAQWL